jgi:hypothetical protein
MLQKITDATHYDYEIKYVKQETCTQLIRLPSKLLNNITDMTDTNHGWHTQQIILPGIATVQSYSVHGVTALVIGTQILITDNLIRGSVFT